MATTFALWSGPARAQESASVDVSGSQVTVTVLSTPGYQARVELPDDSIASTALIGPDGQGVMVFELPAGDYELEVIVFDLAGTPTSLGEHAVHVAGPPPGPPTVVVTPGTAADNRTVFALTGTGGSHFEIEATSEGQPTKTASGELGGDGKGRGVIVLPSGDWNYSVTLSNDGGTSPSSSASVHVELGPPPAPVLELASDRGQTPVTIRVTGPAEGRAVVTATLEGETVREDTELDIDGKGDVDLDLREDGTWAISATAFDIEDKESPAGQLEGGALVSREGPPLDLELISAGEGEFAYRVTTDVGVHIEVTSETPALRQSFTAEDEETEFHVQVPEGEHLIEVVATDEFGNTTTASLSSQESAGGSNWGILALIIAGIVVALGIYAFMRRQEIIDWWNTRQYH